MQSCWDQSWLSYQETSHDMATIHEVAGVILSQKIRMVTKETQCEIAVFADDTSVSSIAPLLCETKSHISCYYGITIQKKDCSGYRCHIGVKLCDSARASSPCSCQVVERRNK